MAYGLFLLIADTIVSPLSLTPAERITERVGFFFFEAPEVFFLLTIVYCGVGIIQS